MLRPLVWERNCFQVTQAIPHKITADDLSEGNRLFWKELWVQIETLLSDNYCQATVKVRLEIDSQVVVNAKASFRIERHGLDITATIESSLQAGSNIIQAQILLPEPSLSWPNGQGEQPLHALRVQRQDSRSGNELDFRYLKFDVREVRWQSTEGAPLDFINPYNIDWGWSLESWNGFPFFVARLLFRLGGAPDDAVSLSRPPQKDNRIVRPVGRTTLEAHTGPSKTEAENAVVDQFPMVLAYNLCQSAP
jgi:hypothetical protein